MRERKMVRIVLEGGKKFLSGDTQREATTAEEILLRRENDDLKKLSAETFLKYEQYKKAPVTPLKAGTL